MKIDKKGFTLLEMAIGILLTGVIVSAALSLYLTQHKQLLVQNDVTDLQSTIRVAMGELSNKIRMAGFGIPPSMNSIFAYDTNPDTIVLCSNLLDNIQISQAMSMPSSDLLCDDYDISALHDGDTLFIYDPILKTGEYFYASQIQYSPPLIRHNTVDLSQCYPVGSKIMRLNSIKYFIDNSNPDHPNLMIKSGFSDPQVYAENITDLQFKYILSSQDTVDVPIISKMIREVAISVTARTNERDPDFQNQYRTRTLSTRVKVRNLAIN
jgi:prepilin-type N-terminal cleavage/methylation domain-containing protein